MKKIILLTMLMISVVALVACSGDDTSSTSESNQNDAVVANQTTNNSEDVYMTIGFEASYVVPTNYESLKNEASYAFTFKPIEELHSEYVNGVIYTTYNVEVVDSIKGEVNGTIPLRIPGGSITVEEYYNSLDPYQASKQFPNGIETVANQLVVQDDEQTATVTMGEEYLAVANYDEITDEYFIFSDIYGIYSVDGNQAVHEQTGDVIQASDF